LVAMIPCRFN